MKKQKKQQQKQREENSFHMIKKGKVKEGDSSETTGYTRGNSGFMECPPDDDLCYAKKVTFKGEEQIFHSQSRRSLGAKNKIVEKSNHYVKMNSSGQLFNPSGLYSEFTQNKSNIAGDKVWTFTKVSKDCFDLYHRFLSTGNTANITQAERLAHNE